MTPDLDEIRTAWATYKRHYETKGGDHIQTGMAWDALNRLLGHRSPAPDPAGERDGAEGAKKVAKPCRHRMAHRVDAKVAYLEDSGRFCLDIRVKCAACGEPFRFLGLPIGLDLSGAAKSADGTEGRFAICPVSQEPPTGGLLGFSERRTKP